MSSYQKLMATAIAAVALSFIGFAIIILRQPSDVPMPSSTMTMIIIGYIAFVFCVIFAQQRFAKSPSRDFPDEREADLDVKSEQIGYRTLEAGVFILIALTLLGSSNNFAEWGRFSLMRPEGLIFALMSIVTFAGLARLISALLMDRRA